MMNREHLESIGSNDELEGRIQAFELAFRMQMSMPEAQDISDETAATQKQYGLDNPVTANFGRQCLMARRFAERGVRFIQVTHSDSEVQWDQHGSLYKGHSKNAAEVDKPIAGLLKDLKAVVCSTIHWFSGEANSDGHQRLRVKTVAIITHRLYDVARRRRCKAWLCSWSHRRLRLLCTA